MIKKTQNPKQQVSGFHNSDLGLPFVSYFDIRISDFELGSGFCAREVIHATAHR
jgi:hypothetical protein